MSEEFKKVLERIREAFRLVQNGALRRSVWKNEGASNYTTHPKDEQSSDKR